jgi:hypothetical protein
VVVANANHAANQQMKIASRPAPIEAPTMIKKASLKPEAPKLIKKLTPLTPVSTAEV